MCFNEPGAKPKVLGEISQLIRVFSFYHFLRVLFALFRRAAPGALRIRASVQGSRQLADPVPESRFA